MQIVIDIPESIKEHIEDGSYGKRPYDRYLLITAVLNGTPLPKGHGRLIDADILDECKEMMDDICGESKYAVKMDNIRNIPTIIEADKSESEEEK